MDEKLKIVIVGGGTAGWMTAAYLSKALKQQIDIVLIESPSISTIGVGEATFSTLRLFFEFLGLEEENWMPQCNASYKFAIKFVDWNAEHRPFYHPFQRYEVVQGRSIAEWWLTLQRATGRFDYACFSVPALCDAQKSPRYLDGRMFDNAFEEYSKNAAKATTLEHLTVQYPYGYHFDAQLLAKFLSHYAQRDGVVPIMDDVIDVYRAENGNIEYVMTKQSGRIRGNFFIDCTGFRGLLINKALEEPFVSFSDSLLCDSAIAMQVPNDPQSEGINPYTTATALSAGWAWNIPLFNRVGTGYVYSSTFLSRSDAEQEFRNHLGKRARDSEALHIKMRIGRSRNSWVKNCVAIGLSSGFVEPLESTGIFFIQHAVEELVNYFPGKTLDEQFIKSYNRAIANCIDGIREFLTLHYVASTRADTEFWQATKNDIKIDESLSERFELWKNRLPTSKTINPHYHGFEAYSYSVMLLGLGFCPQRASPILDYLDSSAARAAFAEIRNRTQHLVATLPTAYEYLASRYEPSRNNGNLGSK